MILLASPWADDHLPGGLAWMGRGLVYGGYFADSDCGSGSEGL